MSRGRGPQLLFTLFLVAVVFSIQAPLPGVGSKYASVNASDGVLLCIAGLFVWRRARTGDWTVELTMPRMTSWFLIVGGWILVTVLVAVIREPVPVLANTLWALKWFEIVVLAVLVQSFASEIDWDRLLAVLIGGGVVVAVVGLFQSLTASSTFGRATVLWQNPNTMAVFLALPGLLSLLNGALWMGDRPRRARLSFSIGVICLLGLLSTGSRSGMVTLVVGMCLGVYLLRKRLPVRLFAGGLGGGLSVAGALVFTTRPWLIDRLIPIQLAGGTLRVNQAFVGGLESRSRLAIEAVDLWTRQPIFGYGWFASPENPRVGYLDILYTQLLVDTGAFGFILIMVFYLVVVRTFLASRTAESLVVPVAGASWMVGLLVAGIGGAHARVPRLMFLLVVVLAIAVAFRSRKTRTFWA